MILDRDEEIRQATVKVLKNNMKEMDQLKKQIKIQSKFVLLTTAGFLTSLGTCVFLYLKYVA